MSSGGVSPPPVSQVTEYEPELYGTVTALSPSGQQVEKGVPSAGFAGHRIRAGALRHGDRTFSVRAADEEGCPKLFLDEIELVRAADITEPNVGHAVRCHA